MRLRAHSNADELFDFLEASEERQVKALTNFYKLNSAPRAKYDIRINGRTVLLIALACLIICAVGIGLLVQQ